MQLKGKDLVEWFKGISPKKGFPLNGKVNYFTRYNSIKEFLDNYIHPEITAMTLAFDDKIYLTKHGTEHIDAVIQKLSKLVDTNSTKDLELTPYEVYLLLVATQLHDTGHIKKGRESHEINTGTVMQSLGKIMGTETAEKKMIWTIAEAHGGRMPDGKKDKIDKLPVDEPILGHRVRPRILAALLRFADELSDDFSRANKILLEGEMLKKESEIFHEYASALHSVVVDHEGREIRLAYLLGHEQLKKKYGKGEKDGKISNVFLIDEIYDRLYKMYMEFIYCMRFIPYLNKFDTIFAKITFADSNSYSEFRDPISIKLSEKGYPQLNGSSLFDLCPESLYDNGNKITGVYLKKSLNN